jgi:hypothetical protein
MDTEDFIFVLLFVGLFVLALISLIFPIVLAMIISAGYLILIAMIGFLCGFISGTRIFLRLTIFVYRPYDLTMNPLYYRIREFLAKKIEKIIVILLIASSVFCILIELSYYGINIFPFNLLEYGVFISNFALAGNIIIIEKIPSEKSDWWVKLFLYILAASLFLYGITVFYRGIPEPLYPPDVYPEMYQLQKHLPFLCLSTFNVAGSLGLSSTLIGAYCERY